MQPLRPAYILNLMLEQNFLYKVLAGWTFFTNSSCQIPIKPQSLETALTMLLPDPGPLQILLIIVSPGKLPWSIMSFSSSLEHFLSLFLIFCVLKSCTVRGLYSEGWPLTRSIWCFFRDQTLVMLLVGIPQKWYCVLSALHYGAHRSSPSWRS